MVERSTAIARVRQKTQREFSVKRESAMAAIPQLFDVNEFTPIIPLPFKYAGWRRRTVSQTPRSKRVLWTHPHHCPNGTYTDHQGRKHRLRGEADIIDFYEYHDLACFACGQFGQYPSKHHPDWKPDPSHRFYSP